MDMEATQVIKRRKASTIRPGDVLAIGMGTPLLVVDVEHLDNGPAGIRVTTHDDEWYFFDADRKVATVVEA